MNQSIQLLKYLQKTKDITRREFEDMMKEEAIHKNGEKITSFSEEVQIGDELKIYLPEGETFEENISKIPVTNPKMVVFNKPKGYVVSKDDTHNKTIFELLPASWQKDFYYIGRLDKQSHGLLLLTNEPERVDYYEKPSNKLARIYEVQLNKSMSSSDYARAKKGVLVSPEGRRIFNPKSSKAENAETLQFHDIKPLNHSKNTVKIVLKQGKNRHIRKLLNSLGYRIINLKRVRFGKFQLGNIKPGKYQIFKK